MQADNADTEATLEKLRTKLPSYMVPRTIRLLRQFPLNPNGKFDRKALFKLLEKPA
jgi:D-alanine--poly(phosphoribitol) ligase subunit 1